MGIALIGVRIHIGEVIGVRIGLIRHTFGDGVDVFLVGMGVVDKFLP